MNSVVEPEAGPPQAVDAGAPAAPSESAIEAASRIWATRCATCHGTTGHGDTEQGKALKLPDMGRPAWQAGRTNAQLARVIREGYVGTTDGVRQHMPDFARLPDDEVRALVVIVRRFFPSPKQP